MAGDSHVEWHGPEVEAAIADAAVDALQRAGDVLVGQHRDRLSSPYPPASRPGQPPHRRSGRLHDDQTSWVTKDADGVVLHVGVQPSAPSAEYAAMLIGGTSNMSPRPWIDEQTVALAAETLLADAIGADVQ